VGWGLRALAGLLVLASASLAVLACTTNCATYSVSVVVMDSTTQALVCDARVTLLPENARAEAGVVLDASAPPSDAEAPASSSACQWYVVVGGGSYQITATAPGFTPGTATLEVPTDVCGSAPVSVTVVLVRS